ncbi:hypothetical protein ACVWYF_000323 [Hymenobacter sp. UYAg731]
MSLFENVMQNQKYLDNLTYVVSLSVAGGQSLGSGFILTHNGSDYIITAKHVVFKGETLIDTSLLVTAKNIRDEITVSFLFEVYLDKTDIIHNMVNDFVAILLPNRGDYSTSELITLFNEYPHEIITVSSSDTRGINEIRAPNQVYLIGFPTSLLFNKIITGFDVSRPLFRKGIIAGYNIGSDTFIIDCFAYYGNSGGPVLEVCEDDTIRIIGLVSQYVPFSTVWKNNRESSIEHVEYTNSGYTVCISTDAVLRLIDSSSFPKA